MNDITAIRKRKGLNQVKWNRKKKKKKKIKIKVKIKWDKNKTT